MKFNNNEVDNTMTAELLMRENEALKKENERLRYGMTALLKELDECKILLGVKEKAEEKKLDNQYTPDEIIKLADLLSKKVTELPLSTFTKNVLCFSDFYTFGEFLRGGKENYSKLCNKGPKARNEIEAFMKENGLTWDVCVDDIIEISAKHILSKK